MLHRSFNAWITGLCRVAMVIIVGMLLGGCVDVGDSRTKGKPAVTPPAGVTPPKGFAAVGQARVGGGMTIRLVSAELTESIPGLPRPTTGRRYLLLDLNVERTSSEAPSFTNRRLYLHTGLERLEQSDVGMPMPIPDAQGGVPDDALPAGGHHPGLIAFNVAAGARGFRMVYITDWSGGVSMGWWIAGEAAEPHAVPAERCPDLSERRPGSTDLRVAPGQGYYGIARQNLEVSEGQFSEIVSTDALAAAAAVEETVACINAGDRSGMVSMVTTDFLRRYPAVVAMLDGTGRALPTRQLRIASVDTLHTVLGYEYWMRANVVILDPDRPDEVISAQVTLHRQDGHWRIDDVEGDAWLVTAFGATSSASPVPSG